MKRIKSIIYWNPSKLSIIFLTMIPFLLYVIKSFELDGDFWFIINLGKSIIHKGFITIDTFTIHEGLSFIPQQWLSDVFFYIIFKLFKIYGVFIFMIFINYLIMFLVNKTSYFLSKNRALSLIICISFDIILLGFNFITTRPHIFDIIILLTELCILEKYIENNKNKLLYFLPLLSLLYINLHASTWYLFFIFMFPYVLEVFITNIKLRKLNNIIPIVISGLVSFVIGFINPYTYKSVFYFFDSYGVKEINALVGEMKPVTLDNGLFLFIFIIISLFIFFSKRSKNIRHIILIIITIYITLCHIKGYPYFLIAFTLLLSNYVKTDMKVKNIRSNKMEKSIYILLIIISALFICINIKIREYPSIKNVADYLDTNASKNIKLYTNSYTGTFLEYRGYKCYIDNRAEVFIKKNNLKEDIYKEYYQLLVGNLDIDSFINKYNFDYLLVDDINNRKMIEYLNENNYEILLTGYDDVNKTNYYLYKLII